MSNEITTAIKGQGYNNVQERNTTISRSSEEAQYQPVKLEEAIGVGRMSRAGSAKKKKKILTSYQTGYFPTRAML